MLMPMLVMMFVQCCHAQITTVSQLTVDQLCTFDSNDSGKIDIVDILAVLGAYNIEFDTSACAEIQQSCNDTLAIELDRLQADCATTLNATLNATIEELIDFQQMAVSLLESRHTTPQVALEATIVMLTSRISQMHCNHVRCFPAPSPPPPPACGSSCTARTTLEYAH
jgi:hypothetical protein